MKTTLFTPTVWLGIAALAAGARAQDAAPAPAPAPERAAAPDAGAGAPATPAAPGGLRFNFRGAPLETVLNYMSEAAGFIIVLETPVRGTVDMWSAQPVSRQEAVQLLNIALNKNGYSATVQGRSLVVSSKDDAKKHNLPIHTGNDPEEIPATAEMVMQIIPVRHIDAKQAATDLATLLPGSATITANQDSNSLVVTDTQMNVKHIVELVSALDTSVDAVSAMKIFKLKNADPYEMASLLNGLYQTTQTAGGANGQAGRGGFGAAGFGGGGRGGFGGGGFGGGGFGGGGFVGAGGAGGGGGGGAARRAGGTTASTNRTVPVIAVADPRTYSVIVTGPKDLMGDISEMVSQLDSSAARKQKVFVYTLENADVKQTEAILKNLFQSTTTRSSTSNQPDPLTTRATANTQPTTGSSINLGTSSGSGGRGVP